MTKTVEQAVEVIKGLVDLYWQNTCLHEETRRGGSIWEICNQCGEQWADDRGGKPDFVTPQWVEKAEAFISEAAQWKAKQGKEWVDGLPPVGSTNDDFEIIGSDPDHKFEVLAHRLGHAILLYIPRVKINGGSFGVTTASPEDFRPIKSDRDKAIEEMANIIGQPDDEGYTVTPAIVDKIAETLHSHGYRKQMSREEVIDLIGPDGVVQLSEFLANQIADALGFDQ